MSSAAVVIEALRVFTALTCIVGNFHQGSILADVYFLSPLNLLARANKLFAIRISPFEAASPIC